MIALPRLGMGCAGIGNLYRPVDERTAEATVAAALAAGIRYFDVAPFYGFGLAEQRLGRALAAHDPARTAIVSTKVGRVLIPADQPAPTRHGYAEALPFEPVFDYSRDGVLRSHEASLARLGRDRVNILFAHDLGGQTHGPEADRHLRAFLDGGYPALRELRDAGVIDAIGIGVNEVEVCHAVLDHADLDLILLAGRYTLLEQFAAEPLLARCAQRGTRVVIGGAFNSGVLAEGSARAATSHFNYAPPPPEIVDKVAQLEAICARFDVPLPAAALQFPRRAPAVASVIVGLVGADQVAAAMRYAGEAIPAPLWPACRAAMAPAHLMEITR